MPIFSDTPLQMKQTVHKIPQNLNFFTAWYGTLSSGGPRGGARGAPPPRPPAYLSVWIRHCSVRGN